MSTMRLPTIQPDLVGQIREAIEQKIEGATVEVEGSRGHYTITVVSGVFEGKNAVQSQRLVYSAIRHLMDGPNAPLHAVDKLVTRVS
jgi:acid stress-induced BolA-like protein IbaG/YrbA